jgi:3-oxoadipate enol-lactonase
MPTICISDADLYYEMSGEGEPVLLIHGLGGSAQDWDRQIAAFRSSYRVIAFDLRGHGRSEKPIGPYTVAQFARDAAGLLGALGIDSAHVVGWSLGGMVAFQLAVDRPDLVRSLVVVNAMPEFHVRTYAERLWLHQRQMTVRVLGMRHFAETLAKQLFPKPSQKLQRRQMIERFSQNDPRAYLASLTAGTQGWSVVEHLHEIRCPVVMITGDKDYTSAEQKAKYAAEMPDAHVLVVKDSRHATPADQPTAFNKAVRAFLAGDRVMTSIGVEEVQPRFWFPRKKRGWGWGLPARWQGWLVYAAYLGFSLVGVRELKAEYAALGSVLYVGLMTAALFGVIALTGERASGTRDDNER